MQMMNTEIGRRLTDIIKRKKKINYYKRPEYAVDHEHEGVSGDRRQILWIYDYTSLLSFHR